MAKKRRFRANNAGFGGQKQQNNEYKAGIG